MDTRSPHPLPVHHRTPRRVRRSWAAGAILLLTLLAGCEDVRIGGPGARFDLISGSYDYSAWSDRYRDLAWWGSVDLRVDSSGRITGSYRLPRQCADQFGRGVDCRGRVSGRVYRDGYLDFRFDDGWLTHEGSVDRRSDAFGRWWARLTSLRDDGRFELLRY